MTQILNVRPDVLSETFSGGSGSDSSLIADKLVEALSVVESATARNAAAPRAGESIEDQLFDSRSACKITTAHIAMHFSEQWRRGLFRQLDTLIDFENWDEEDLPPNPESFRTLLRMVLLLKPRRRPGLGATATGNFTAMWSIDDSHLTIECKQGDQLRWFVSLAGETAGGRTTLARLSEVLAPYHPEIWFEKAVAQADPR